MPQSALNSLRKRAEKNALKYRLNPLVILKAGERLTGGGLNGNSLNAEVIARIGEGLTKLYVMGWIRYRDDRNIIRETRIWNSS